MKASVYAVLLGTAVGDSLGLPAENLSARKIQKRWPGPWRQRFVFGGGMVSDDTEHTVFVAQCLAERLPNADAFQRKLAWKLRWWLACIPVGIGFATLRSIFKLWLGFSPSRSGVFSAGNGPAMRSAILGVYFAGKMELLREYVRVSTRLTHIDSKAETAALAVALTASWSAMSDGAAPTMEAIREIWIAANPDDLVWIELVNKILSAYDRNLTVMETAGELGLQKGVSGYAYHTVPVALYSWLRHFGDYRAGLEAALSCGGDTDTVGAITGALLAINSDVPDDWSMAMCDYPISRSYLEKLAVAVESENATAPVFLWVALPFRSLIFLAIVLAHICRRLLPF